MSKSATRSFVNKDLRTTNMDTYGHDPEQQGPKNQKQSKDMRVFMTSHALRGNNP